MADSITVIFSKTLKKKKKKKGTLREMKKQKVRQESPRILTKLQQMCLSLLHPLPPQPPIFAHSLKLFFFSL